MEENSLQSGSPPPLPPLADGKFHQLDPNWIPAERMGLAIRSLVIIGIALMALLLAVVAISLSRTATLAAIGLWLALIPALAIYSWVWPPISYRHASYCLKEDCIISRRGVFWKIEAMVPKNRIQHTDISQGPLQRSYRIADLIIHTAGTRFALVPVGGLPEQLAPRLRNHLLDRKDDAVR